MVAAKPPRTITVPVMPAPSAQDLLGSLQYGVMQVLWTEGDGTVRSVLDRLNAGRIGTSPLAYTTVMTVLNRLCELGFVQRRPDGRAYRYTPLHPEDEVADHVGRRETRELLDRLGDVVLVPFAEALAEADPGLLRHLTRLAEGEPG